MSSPIGYMPSSLTRTNSRNFGYTFGSDNDNDENDSLGIALSSKFTTLPVSKPADKPENFQRMFQDHGIVVGDVSVDSDAISDTDGISTNKLSSNPKSSLMSRYTFSDSHNPGLNREIDPTIAAPNGELVTNNYSTRSPNDYGSYSTGTPIYGDQINGPNTSIDYSATYDSHHLNVNDAPAPSSKLKHQNRPHSAGQNAGNGRLPSRVEAHQPDTLSISSSLGENILESLKEILASLKSGGILEEQQKSLANSCKVAEQLLGELALAKSAVSSDRVRVEAEALALAQWKVACDHQTTLLQTELSEQNANLKLSRSQLEQVQVSLAASVTHTRGVLGVVEGELAVLKEALAPAREELARTLEESRRNSARIQDLEQQEQTLARTRGQLRAEQLEVQELLMRLREREKGLLEREKQVLRRETEVQMREGALVEAEKRLRAAESEANELSQTLSAKAIETERLKGEVIAERELLIAQKEAWRAAGHLEKPSIKPLQLNENMNLLGIGAPRGVELTKISHVDAIKAAYASIGQEMPSRVPI